MGKLKEVSGWMGTFWSELESALAAVSPEGWEFAFKGMARDRDPLVKTKYSQIANVIVHSHQGIDSVRLLGLQRAIVRHCWEQSPKCAKVLIWLLGKSNFLRLSVCITLPKENWLLDLEQELEPDFLSLGNVLADYSEMMGVYFRFKVLQGAYSPAEERVVTDDTSITVFLTIKKNEMVRGSLWHTSENSRIEMYETDLQHFLNSGA